MFEWLTAKAKDSWIFSLVLVFLMVWELIEHFVLPIAAAALGAFWLWSK
jgi:predicted PurR-regulated permease PerM